MKRTVANILIFILVLTMILPAVAFATNEGGDPSTSPTPTPTEAPTPTPTEKVIKKPSVTISTSPTELVADGSVSLSISVYNPNSFELTNVAISVGGSTVKTVSAIVGGSTYNYSGKYSVSAANLGKKINVTVAYDGGSVSDSFTIAQKEAKININTIVKVDKSAVEVGGKVNFSFSIENKSDIAIENASIKASTLNGGQRLGKVFSLDANGDATIVLHTETITQTIDVKPVLTFMAAGKNYTKELDTITITVNDAMLEITATPSTAMADADTPVEFTLSLVNTGNVDFKKITLYDANDRQVITGSNQLVAGGMLSAKHSMTFTESGSYDFYVVAMDEAGTSYSFRSNPVKIQVDASVSDYSQYLTLTAVSGEESGMLKEPGEVTFELTLRNTYTEPFRNVEITEANSGAVIETYSSFPAGEKVLFYSAEIEETTNFDFLLTATDPEGNPFTVTVDRISISVEESKNGSSKLSTLLIVLIIIIVLIVGCGVTLVVLVVKEKKKKEDREFRRESAVSDARRAARISRATHAVARDVAEAERDDDLQAGVSANSIPEEEDVKIYSGRTARRSYESLVAEPAARKETEHVSAEAMTEESATPEEVLSFEPQEAPVPEEQKPELELPPVPKRKHREFEDRNLF